MISFLACLIRSTSKTLNPTSAIRAQIARNSDCTNMLYLTLLICIFTAVLLAAGSSYGLTTDRVLATVDNDVITFSDYQRFIEDIGHIENKEIVNEAMLKRLIEEKLILHEAKRKNIEVSDAEIDRMIEEFKEQNALSQEDLERELARENMNIHSYKMSMKDKIMTLKLISEKVDSRIVITDKEIEDFYNANKRDYLSSPEKVAIRAIFLRLNEDPSVTEITDFKRRVLKIVDQLKNGESFENLMDQYSDEQLNGQDGKLGEFVKGALIPPLDNKAFTMKKGEISDPIWVGGGAYILQLINRIPESFKTLAEVRGDIQEHLYKLKREKLLNEWVRSLWENASITIK